MTRLLRRNSWALFLVLPLLLGATVPRCQGPNIRFEPISRHGFDGIDYVQDINDYPWGMAYFTPDGADTGHLYVSTGNSIMNQTIAQIGKRIGMEVDDAELARPPEIRRYRPDHGPMAWERVLDYRDHETGPEWNATGFRVLAVYQAQSDGRTYLYAGTQARRTIALWRSLTGEPGSWEQVWTVPLPGSIRALVEHNGLLYIGMTHEEMSPEPPSELYATDGESFWLVNGDGFGNPNNTSVYTLASFNECLYAGTANSTDGYEIWKLEGPTKAAPARIVSAGGTSRGIMGTSEMVEFQGHLYVGTGLFLGLDMSDGINFRAADMIRIAPDDTWETVVGPGSDGGTPSGFGNLSNSYLWSIQEHDGRLYCGTWDAASMIPILVSYFPDIATSLIDHYLGGQKLRPDLYDIVTDNGAELWVSSDGVTWASVFSTGVDNPDNYGIRTMASAEGRLFLGMANVFEGLEIFRSVDAE